MDNWNCNVNYDKIKKRIEECNKNIKYVYIQGPTVPQGKDGREGPTWPKGENGPTTIDIGTTITGMPNTEATVKNIGTNKNVILNFTIPQGQDGINGYKIIIGKTETLDANARAKVGDTQIGNIHTLDFYIPQGFDGADGDIGPKGDKGDIGEQGPKGDTGKSEGIQVINTQTINPGQLAEGKDNFDGDTHHLIIPKGDKGNIGDRGDPGSMEPVLYNALFFGCCTRNFCFRSRNIRKVKESTKYKWIF